MLPASISGKGFTLALGIFKSFTINNVLYLLLENVEIKEESLGRGPVIIEPHPKRESKVVGQSHFLGLGQHYSGGLSTTLNPLVLLEEGKGELNLIH